MAYNKKQMKPLIDKYQINPETNKLFIRVTDMFDGQPNYQIWAVKMIFSQVIDIDKLVEIKRWIDENQSSIAKLEKKNVVSYSSKSAISQLNKEMGAISKMNLIRDVISHFNTDQRKMLTDAIFTKDFTPLEAYSEQSINSWYEIFSSFNKKPSSRKNKFYSSCSAVKDMNTLRKLIIDCLQESYEWNRDDLLSYVEHNTKDCKVIYDNNNVVILRVPSYDSSHKLCGSGRTQWCLARELDYFKRYVTNRNAAQYFLFDFNRKESDCFAHIGFTVEGNKGITEAQTTNNYSMLGASGYAQGSEVLNINQVLSKLNIKMSKFMPLNSNLKWDIKSVIELVKSQSNNYAIAYESDGRLIINVLTRRGLVDMTNGTFIKNDGFMIDKNNKVYIFLDFNMPIDEDRSMIAIQYQKDTYGTMSLIRMEDVFGAEITKEGYLSKIGISSNDFLQREKIDPAILLHKLIDERDEVGAINMIKEDGGNLNVNFEFNQRVPIFSAINHHMFDLFEVLVNHPKFDNSVQDGFGETLLENLLFLHGSEDVVVSEADQKMLVKMINIILDAKNFDFNAFDLNNDTALTTACEYPSQVFVVERLVKKKSVNVNVVNDFDCTALSNCIRNNNLEAMKVLGQRPDLVVTEQDEKFAKMFNVNLEDYIKPNPNIFEEEATVDSLEEAFSEAMG